MSNDPLDRAVTFDDNRHYDIPGHECANATRERALDAAETLLALVAAGKLDRIDVRIVEERSRSPMPTERDVAAIVGLSCVAVHKRVSKIRSAMIASNIGLASTRLAKPAYR